MAFDFKKEYKEFYLPKDTPQIVTVPKANYVAVRGKGNGYVFDLSETRRHHEIYLSDPRKGSPDKNRCVIRYPVKKEGAAENE